MKGKIIEIIKDEGCDDYWLKIEWESGLITQKMAKDVFVIRS